MDRRKFMKNVAHSTLALSSATSFASAQSDERVLGANERVHVGLIGCGGRGSYVARNMRGVPHVEIAAVCDVYDLHLNRAGQIFEPRFGEFNDFRLLLERNDLDAVIVATPDHWHAIPTVLACQAGKDVYVEKPLALTVRDGQKMLKAARQYNRIVQAGTQQRSATHFAEIRQMIQDGELGEVHFIRVWNYRNIFPKGIGYQPDSEPPAGLDWDFYLGPSPFVPYNFNRFKNFRWFLDYSGGIITDYGTHRFDTVHQIMNQDTPLAISASGSKYSLQDAGEIPDIMQVTYEYPDFVLSYEACALNAQGVGGQVPGREYYNAKREHDRPNGIAFYGTEGTIFADRIGYEFYPEGERLKKKVVVAQDAIAAHVENFIHCVRSRHNPVADIQIGHRSTVTPHLGNIAWKIGRKLHWNGATEDFVNDPEASQYLSRPMRKPWNLI